MAAVFLVFHFSFQVLLFFAAWLLHQPVLPILPALFFQIVHKGESICRLSILSSPISSQDPLLTYHFYRVQRFAS